MLWPEPEPARVRAMHAGETKGLKTVLSTRLLSPRSGRPPAAVRAEGLTSQCGNEEIALHPATVTLAI